MGTVTLGFTGLTIVWAAFAPDGRWPAVLIVLGFAAIVVCISLSIAIALLNRPKALVPPHLRREPGYLAEQRDVNGDRMST